MKVRKEARKGAQILFQAVHTDGRIDLAKVRLALSEVVARKPTFQAETLKELHRLVRLELESRSAQVQTATELTPADRGNILASLQKRFGADVSATFSVNPALIAGIRLKVGSDVYDSSVRERLSRLQVDLSH